MILMPLDYVQMPHIEIMERQKREFAISSTGSKNILFNSNYNENDFESGYFASAIEELVKNNLIRQSNRSNRWEPDFLKVSEGIIERDLLSQISEDILQGLFSTDSKKVTFERTPDKSILLKGSVKNMDYFLEVFSDPESGYDAFLNVFENRKLLQSVSGSITQLFASLNECVS